MATKIDIYNRALQEFQEDPIASLSDDVQSRKIIDGFYDSVRQEVLIERKWTFAFRASALAAVTLPDEYVDIWQAAYSYPVDGLQLDRVYVKGGQDCGHIVRLALDELLQQQKIILSNEEQALASYVSDVTNTALYTPLFVQAFVMKLAASIVVPLTNNIQAKALFLQLYDKILAKAEESDSEDSKPIKPDRLDSFASARVGFGIDPDCADSSAGGRAAILGPPFV